jgi:hypothetical protein
VTDTEHEAHRSEVIAKARAMVREAEANGYTRPTLRALEEELKALDSYEERHPA